ncbi:MAG: hypothetical protein GXO91_04315 [FCB group bacterium]|nr:hypothetical protein [FCB group bacterium]
MKKRHIVVVMLVIGLAWADSGIGFGKMVAGGGAGFSGLGFGLTGNFEYGITDNIGIQAAITRQSYNTAGYDWSFMPIDIWATYHSDKFNTGFLKNFADVDAYIMGGVTMTTYSYKNSAGDNSDTSVSIGFGAGFRKPLKGKMSFFGEGRYRLASFEYGGTKLSVFWYSIAGGISFDLN